jgi:hypothetical protein
VTRCGAGIVDVTGAEVISMVTNTVLITIVVSLAAVTISAMGLITKLLGDRVTELGTALGSRIGGVESRLGSVDSRLNGIEGAVRDIGERLTVLEIGLGKR